MFSACTSIKVAASLHKVADLPKEHLSPLDPVLSFSSFFSGFHIAAVETCSYCRLVPAASNGRSTLCVQGCVGASLVGHHLNTAGGGPLCLCFPSLSSLLSVCPVCPSEAPAACLHSQQPRPWGCGRGGARSVGLLPADFPLPLPQCKGDRRLPARGTCRSSRLGQRPWREQPFPRLRAGVQGDAVSAVSPGRLWTEVSAGWSTDVLSSPASCTPSIPP